MYRHAVVDEKTHIVKNVIKWDGVANWRPPVGTYVVRHDICDIGDFYDKGANQFIKNHVIAQEA